MTMYTCAYTVKELVYVNAKLRVWASALRMAKQNAVKRTVFGKYSFVGRSLAPESFLHHSMFSTPTHQFWRF